LGKPFRAQRGLERHDRLKADLN